MDKIAIIGLGLVGNSIGMALKRAYAEAGAPSTKVVGFDPQREREHNALRIHNSVDEIAPNLEGVVRGAQLVVIATPGAAVREVLATIAPFLDEGATVTDTLSSKVEVIGWASECIGPHASFVGGHPFSKKMDLERITEGTQPDPALFRNAPYAIIPMRGASNEALNRVIGLAEALGAQPLFIDPQEHDSFMAATSGLPALASAAMWHVAAGSPAWGDMSALANEQFKAATQLLGDDPEEVSSALMGNRHALIGWVDRYMLALQDFRDLLANEDREGLGEMLEEAHEAHGAWAVEGGVHDHREVKLRTELRQAIDDSRPGRSMMGDYLADRFFRRKDKTKS